VKLTGTCPYLTESAMQLVLDDSEQVPVDLTPVPWPPNQMPADKKHRIWIGEWHDPDHPRRQFPTKGTKGSVRLGGARTNCRRSVEESNDDRLEAVFTFDCDENKATDVLVETEPPDPFRYVRFLRRAGHGALDCDCLEAATFTGTRT